MTPEGQALLLEAGRALGLDLAPHLKAFATLQAALQAASAQTNLTALRGERDIILKHFVDSLSCLRSGEFEGPQKVIDLGTGAGFPGLPLAIVKPQLDVHLLDATRRKIDFVAGVARELKLANAHPQVGRAEVLGRVEGEREAYDRVVTRAVSSLAVLAELSLPLLRVGGLLIAQKGQGVEAELSAGEAAAREVGGEIAEVSRFDLPISGEPRALVLIRKTRPTPEKYPRREGMPEKRPLG